MVYYVSPVDLAGLDSPPVRPPGETDLLIALLYQVCPNCSQRSDDYQSSMVHCESHSRLPGPFALFRSVRLNLVQLCRAYRHGLQGCSSETTTWNTPRI